MRFCIALVLSLALAAQGHASVSKQDAKAAQSAFKRGVELEKKQQYEEAFSSFQEAARLNPENVQYTTARELMRQQLVSDHLKNGNAAILAADESKNLTAEDRRVKAMAEFQAALDLDPANNYAAERLHSLVEEVPTPSPTLEQISEQSGEIRVRPSPQLKDIHFRGDSRALMTRIADLYGLKPVFDENFTPLAVSLEMNKASFEQAIAAAAPQAHVMWTALSEKEIFFANDTPENRRQYEHMLLRTFYVPDASTPETLNELVALLRSIYEIRYVVADQKQSTITVRASRFTLDAAADFISNLNLARPQVMLDIQAYEVSGDLLSNLGVTAPTQFQLVNLGSAVLSTNIPNLQNQIQDLITKAQSGTLSAQDLATIQSLEQQIQQQQNSQLGKLLNQPFILFGGGIARSAVVIPALSVNLTFNHSWVKNLEHIQLRAAQGQSATMQIGERFPVQNAVYSPIVSNPLLNAPGASVSNFPSFSYEDLGITLKAKPLIHMHMVPNTVASNAAAANPADPNAKPAIPVPKREEAEVTLDLDLSIRSLSGTSFNNVPVISNHQFTGTVRLQDGEPALVAGYITRDQQRSLSGLPFFSQLFGPVTSNENKSHTEDEILVIVTPHIVRAPDQLENPEQWLPPGSP